MPKKDLRLGILVAFFFLFSTTLAGVRELRSMTTSEGLSDLLVNTIFKDSTGYIWFGTEMALDRYDGNRIKTFRFPNAGGVQQRVYAITELRRGEIYVGNREGLYELSSQTGELRRLLSDKIKFPVEALADDGDRHLYIGTRQGLFRYDARSGELSHTLFHPDAMSVDNEITGLWMDTPAGLWVASSHSIYYLDTKTGKTVTYPLPGKYPITRLYGYGHTLYICTHGGGVVPFDISTHSFGDSIDLGNNIITGLSCDAGGNLYVSTDGDGIYIFSLPQSRVTGHLTTAKGSPLPLHSNSVYSILADDLGLLWIGYYQSGVGYTAKFNDFFRVYDAGGEIRQTGFPVRAMAIGDGYKIIGTREGLIYVDERNHMIRKYVNPEIGSNIIFYITRVGDKYYIGTYGGGMYVFDPATLHLEEFETNGDFPAMRDIFVIVPDRDGDIWTGTSGGLYRMRNGRILSHFTSLNSQLPEGNVYEVFFDSTGRGWICTENGMAIWDGSTLRTGRFPRDFFDKVKIRDIFEDSRHRLYFAPDRGDVYYSSLDLTDFGTLDFGMPNPMTMATFMTEDKEGHIWFGSDKGLFSYDGKNHLHQFNYADGIPNPVFTLCPPVTDERGDIWFGNSEGLIQLDYGKFLSEKGSLHTEDMLTDMVVDGKSILNHVGEDEQGRCLIELEADAGMLEIMLSNFGYILPEYHAVEYSLEGFDREWRRKDGRTPIEYSHLPAGKYVLKVRIPGDPSTEREILKISKKSGFSVIWLTVGLLVAVIVSGAVYLKVKKRRMAASSGGDGNAEKSERSENEDEKVARYKTTSLSEEECKRLVKKLDEVMKHDRPFTNPDLKSGELAALTGTTSHSLSYVFNQYMKKSFYDYVNGYRVEEFKRLVEDADISKYTLTAMSQKCGFSSRASFFRHFKNITGITPAEYIKQKNL